MRDQTQEAALLMAAEHARHEDFLPGFAFEGGQGFAVGRREFTGVGVNMGREEFHEVKLQEILQPSSEEQISIR